MLGSGCKSSLTVCRASVSAVQVPRQAQGEGPSLGRHLRGTTHSNRKCVGNFGDDLQGTGQGWGDAPNSTAMCRDVPCGKGVVEGVSWPCICPQNLLSGVLPMGKGWRQCPCEARLVVQDREVVCQGGRQAAVLQGHCSCMVEGGLGVAQRWCVEGERGVACIQHSKGYGSAGRCTVRGGHCIGPECPALREALLQRTGLRCRSVSAGEMLSAAQNQSRGRAGCSVLHSARGVYWDGGADPWGRLHGKGMPSAAQY